MSAAQPGPPVKHTGRNIAIIVVVLLFIVIALAVVPVPHSVSYNLTINNPGSATTTYYQYQSVCPTGATVSVSFSVQSGATVTFSVTDPSGSTVWSDDASSGSTTFTAQSCGSYGFGAYDWLAETVDVSIGVASTSPML